MKFDKKKFEEGIKKADEEINKEKTKEKDIELKTAYTWAGRACQVYINASKVTNEKERFDLIDWGDDLKHEAIEHAALVEDYGELLAELQKAIESYRNKALLKGMKTQSSFKI